MIGSLIGRKTTLSEPEYVFQRYDGRIDHHTDGESQSGQRNDIDRQTEPGNGHESADDRYRNGGEDNHCRQQAAKKQKEDAEGKYAANENVLLDKVDRRRDVFRLVIDHTQIEVTRRQNGLIQLVDGSPQADHGFHDIHAWRTKRVDNHRFLTVQPPVT